MDLIRLSIKKPVTIIVGILLVGLFGMIGLQRLPYQLSPDVTEPEITVTTIWPGASPYEVEREIIEEQERVLKGVPGLLEMESSSFNNRGTITLKFRIGTLVEDALLRVSNKLDEVPSYPENVEKPIINATGAATSPVIWIILKTTGDNPNHINTYRTYFEDELRQYLERVEGVADLFIGGGTETQMHIILSPEKLAAYGLTIQDVIQVLRTENVNVSAGSLGVGRRDYRIRTVAEFKSVQDIQNTVIRSTGQRRVVVADVAEVRFGYEKLTVSMIQNMKDGIAIGVKPQSGTNILEMTDRVERVVRWINEEKLKAQKLYLDWVYDQRPYIRGAIKLVQMDIIIGGFLAIAALLLFLRSITATVVIATAIPISITGTFIFLFALGRNLNVIALAGLSFAVGILVDNAIVVLENIDRHRMMGKSPMEAAYDGTREVWGAILNTTVSTVAIFLPVVFIKEEAGQLFKDIAIAVTCAVLFSLFVSVTVIPMFSQKLFSAYGKKKTSRFQFLASTGDILVRVIMKMVSFVLRNGVTQVLTILILVILSVLAVFFLLPKMEYLPQGNRNLVINILIPPPGLSYEEREEIGHQLFHTLQPYLGKDHDGFPGIRNMFYVGSESTMILGAISIHEQRAGELVPLFMRTINTVPGIFGVSSQAGVFQTGLGRGRSIEVDLSGEDLNRVVQAAGMMFGMIRKEIPDVQVRPIPSLELLYPEVKFIPEKDRLRAIGMTANDFGIALDVLLDGRKIGDFKQEGQKKIDLVLKASEKNITTPEKLHDALIATPGSRIIPVSSVAELVKSSGIMEIRHFERRRTVTLQVTPPTTFSLQEAMERIENKVIHLMKQQEMLRGIEVGMSGFADKLTEARKILQWNFLLAGFITFLMMAALFENFIYPLIIMFAVPLGAAGGFIGLKLVNLFVAPQPFDILTMLGFVISVGIVVDNATLIVYQALNNIRDYGMDYKEAVLESTRTRLRPISMTTSTTVFGMLPLVLAPGPGSELYRGLGSVVLGGIIFSTVFTIFVIPALLMFFIKMEKREYRPSISGREGILT
jgi:HAE1 family hydrophobic/amphiphilic exporter-1